MDRFVLEVWENVVMFVNVIVRYYLLLDTVYYDCELYDERCKIKIYFLIFSYYVLVVGIRECEYSDFKVLKYILVFEK